jgi:hypothetical protein
MKTEQLETPVKKSKPSLENVEGLKKVQPIARAIRLSKISIMQT